MDAGALLRQARQDAGLTQAEVANLAGTSQQAVAAYEAGHRQPTVPTFERLLAAAGAQLVGQLEPLGADVDARIRRAIATPEAERSASLNLILDFALPALKDVTFALDGPAAALLQGAPMEVTEVGLVLEDDDDALDRVATAMGRRSFRVWCPEIGEFIGMRGQPGSVLREPGVDRVFTVPGELRLRLDSADRIAALPTVPFGEWQLRVVGLWDLARADPGMAALLTRTLEIFAETP